MMSSLIIIFPRDSMNLSLELLHVGYMSEV